MGSCVIHCDSSFCSHSVDLIAAVSSRLLDFAQASWDGCSDTQLGFPLHNDLSLEMVEEEKGALDSRR